MKFFRMFLLMGLLGLTHSVQATSTGWLTNPYHPPVTLRLMLTGELDVVNKTMPAVLEVKLSDDWKTYWRTPGEGGISPSINWQASTNLANVDWLWPAPERFSLLGMQTWGYREHVVFPLLLTVNDLDKLTQLKGKLTLSSCTTICVLTDYELAIDVIPAELSGDVEAMFAYNKALSTVPQKVVADDSGSNGIVLGWDSIKRQLEVVIDDTNWVNLEVIIDGEPDTEFKLVSLNSRSVDNQDESTTTKLVAIFAGESWLGEADLIGKDLNVTLVDDKRALEYASEVQATIIQAPDSSLLKMLLIALFGGLILNVMPCVLPVLGMKLSAVVAAPNLQRNQIRRQFLASALGILVSFWILAGFILVLKFTGQAIGWGVQFQNPWFIGFMALVTSIFAINMLGAFEINLPSSVQTKLATTGGNDTRGHFLQGMFATLLATPCSAPFLGTAVAFALGADVLSLLVIFTALAFGMALPWLLVAAFPQVAKIFPKPGRWMKWVKIGFSVLLLITSLWLVSLLSNFIASSYLFVAAALLLLTFFIFMAKTQGWAAVLATCSLSVMFGIVIAFMTSGQWSKPLPSDLVWAPLNEATIERQVAEGKTVFVNVTADWCISCKANMIGVILQDPVYSELKQDNVSLMKGDWTKPSAQITNFLQSYNRFGVPFNLVYGPGAPNGIPLPVILMPDEVIAVIERASGVRR